MGRTLFGQFSQTQLTGTAPPSPRSPSKENPLYIGIGTLILLILILILLF